MVVRSCIARLYSSDTTSSMHLTAELDKNDTISSLRQCHYPRVELCREYAPLDKILYLARFLSSLQYALDIEQLVLGFCHRLKFVFVKRSFYIFAGQIFQLVRDRYSKHMIDHNEYFFGPVAEVSFLKRSLLHGHAYIVTNF